MAGKGIYRAKRMKATARHSEGPGGSNQAGRGNRDPFPEFEAAPKGIRGEIRDKAIKCHRRLYQDFSPTLASAKLLERDGIRTNDETLRMGFIDSGVGGRPGSIEDRWLVPITTGLKREALGGSS